MGLFKWDNKKQYLIDIRTLYSKSVFGEMAFLEEEPRSATVKTLTPSILLKFSPNELDLNNTLQKKIYDKLVYNISKTSISNLKSMNEIYIKSIRKQLDFGFLFIVCFTFFAIQSAIVDVLNQFGINIKGPIFSWSIVFLTVSFTIILIKRFGFSINQMGITLKNFKESALYGLFISSCIVGLASLIYLILYYFNYTSTPFLTYVLHPKNPFSYVTVLYFLQAYIQEFIGRGVLQTALQNFYNDSKGFYSILIASLLFGFLHISRGLTTASVAFIGSILFGLVYIKHKNLIGVTIVHYVLGVIAILYLDII